MPAQYLNIEARQRPMIPSLASLSDFTVSAGDAVAPEIVLSSPNISLYCFDDATCRAIFTELPPNVDLTTAPFVYQTQFEQAQRLIAMPYDTFRELAQTLPEVQHLILIFSIPRSGTTLMSHILNQLDSVVSLSEPDAASQFYRMRAIDGSRDVELSELLNCTVRMLFKSSGAKAATAYTIKFRAETTQAMDLYRAAFPQAKFLFLYRDAIGVTASFYRLFKASQIPDIMPLDDYVAIFGSVLPDNFWPLLNQLYPSITEITSIQQLTFIWILYNLFYLGQYARGIPMLAVRYADLNGRREQTLTAIFEYCGLPVEQVSKTLVAFETDSQAGTMLAREKSTEGNAFQLSAEQIAEITTILKRHSIINTPDYRLPGTLRL